MGSTRIRQNGGVNQNDWRKNATKIKEGAWVPMGPPMGPPMDTVVHIIVCKTLQNAIDSAEFV